MSAAEQAEWDRNVALIGGEDQLRDLRVEKQFDPPLDQRQLLGAAAEFAHDYKGDWGVLDDGMTVGGVIDLLLGGTVFLINEEDEAEEYSQIHRDGSALPPVVQRSRPGGAGPEKLVALFDEQVHDSRAWFMNTSAIGPREPFTDYFRYRLVHFDNESNKRLSVLATAGRVVGVGVMLASVGLSVKRRDPRMLLGLFLPSLARPLLSGKVGLPEISAFDPLTGIALPMVGGAALDNLRAFTREPGDKVEQIGQLPPPPPLAVAAVQSPALQQVLLAQQTVEALKARDLGSLAGLVAKAELTQAPAAATPAWLAEAKQALQDMGTEQAQPPGPRLGAGLAKARQGPDGIALNLDRRTRPTCRPGSFGADVEPAAGLADDTEARVAVRGDPGSQLAVQQALAAESVVLVSMPIPTTCSPAGTWKLASSPTPMRAATWRSIRNAT